MRQSRRGFSVVELLVALAIVLIIAAIAIPNLLRSRMAANQTSAIGSLRVITTAETSYATTYNMGYSTNLGCLGPPEAGQSPTASAAGFIDSVLAGMSAGSATATQSVKGGYSFDYAPGSADTSGRVGSYTITATPVVLGKTGTNFFYTDDSGVIRQNSRQVAGSSDLVVAD
jgi:prepilin-type N-terminal cleavage/methylation domain-containing protein